MSGSFSTKCDGEVEVKFLEYSDSKTVLLKPDVVEILANGNRPDYDVMAVPALYKSWELSWILLIKR